MNGLSIRVISVGDSINFGYEYEKVHSVFKDAINILYGDKIISVVNREIGGGPTNIVLDVDDLRLFKDVRISGDVISIDGQNIDITQADCYVSDLKEEKLSKSLLFKNLPRVESLLLKEGPFLSSAFLIDPEREAFFITPFERNLMARIRTNFRDFMNGSLDALRELKGTGIGLTPQGDDLINGILISLSVFELVTGISTLSIREKIYDIVSSKNPVSNTFLYFSSKGKVYEVFKKFILSISTREEGIETATMNIINIGETSGADMLTGFIVGVKNFFEGGFQWQ